ncbi:MAG: NADH-quinone oxidoreductase subunit M [Sphingomonadales bacterium]|nr:NADH-quinone oxidoreductase subunit M [Sphingomonadales bacterium]
MELILIPIITALISAWAGKWSRRAALLGSLITGLFILYFFQNFNPAGGLQWQWDKAWFSSAIHFHTGIDGISMIMLILTNVLTPVILLSAFNKKEDTPLLFALIVGMQGALNGVFVARDGLMFYIFWELALIPVYFIAGLWGEGNRFKTTLRFFICTFIGSLAMLASLIYLFSKTPDASSFSYEALVAVKLSANEALWVGLGLLLAFAVKIPLMPLHGWQPSTYTEAPAAGTMLLSGIMLKMGLYGLLRWFMPMVPEALPTFVPVIVAAGITGVIFAALIAIRQNDMKRIVAYSSLSHVGLIAAGIAVAGETGIQGGLLQMFSHGVNAVGLFLAIDIIERRNNTRLLDSLGGMAGQSRAFAVFFLIIVLGATAVPFTNGFPGELLLLKSVFGFHPFWGILAGITVILCAVYMLRMYQFSMFGEPKGTSFPALQWHEWTALSVILIMILFFGLFPQKMLDISAPEVKNLLLLIKNTGEAMS